MARAREPQPLPRDAVRKIYDTIAHSPAPLALSEVRARCPAYSPEQIHWACGTLVRQGIVRPQAAVRSDRKSADPPLEAVLPFEQNYVGWEQAK